MNRRAELLQRRRQRLRTATTRVHDDQNDALRRLACRFEDKSYGIFACLRRRFQDDHTVFGKEKG
ncbi:hypothetical protein GCM10020255_091080 [Rhodococcus baikonurensis]